MSQQSSIEWTDATWNPVTGCDRVSPGCKHCYALDLAARLKAMGNVRYQRDGEPPTSGPGFGVTLHPDKLEEPLRWRKPRRVFVNSMSDLFHPEVPHTFIAGVFATMAVAREHTFQVLTKRPERMREVVGWEHFRDLVDGAVVSIIPSLSRQQQINLNRKQSAWQPLFDWPLPNVWLGTSIESRTYVGRADHLRATPAAVRFISAEPLLGPLVIPKGQGGFFARDRDGEYKVEWPDRHLGDELDLTDIDWLIVGGESGPKHRPMDPQWVRDLRDACLAQRAVAGHTAAGNQDGPRWSETRHEQPHSGQTAFFFKQVGGRTPKAGGRELDGRTWDEFPEPARAMA